MDIVEQAQADVREVRQRIQKLDDDALDLMFRKARSYHAFQDKPVPKSLLREIHALMNWGPTSTNASPGRIIFLTSAEAKAPLIPALNPGNVAKIEGAPVTAIIAYDVEWLDNLARLFPHRDMAGPYKNNPAKAEAGAFSNSSLQGAYFMLAARALGLDVGGISGFDNAKVDEAFFAGTTLKSNFLCNLGYGDETALFQRLPRLEFDEVCEIR